MAATELPDYAQRGGVRIGTGLRALNATWPLATRTVSTSKLSIRSVLGSFVFPKNSIKRLSRHHGFFSVGLRVQHEDPSCPSFVVFWTFGFGRLRDELQRAGYDVDG
jgi:hypothetical protein